MDSPPNCRGNTKKNAHFGFCAICKIIEVGFFLEGFCQNPLKKNPTSIILQYHPNIDKALDPRVGYTGYCTVRGTSNYTKTKRRKDRKINKITYITVMHPGK